MQNIVFQRLNAVCEWWRVTGRPEGGFIRWIRVNFVGNDLGTMHENELYNLISLGRLEAQFPKIIFITSTNLRSS